MDKPPRAKLTRHSIVEVSFIEDRLVGLIVDGVPIELSRLSDAEMRLCETLIEKGMVTDD
jgi:hypothetical protein